MNYSNNSSLLSSNARENKPYYDKAWVNAGVGIYVPLSLAITLGNALVIAAFFSTPKLKTKTNYFIVSLAVADLIVGTFSVPMWMYVLITEDFENPMYDVYQSVDMMSGVSSIMHLTCISLERCYAIAAPLKHMRINKGVLYFAIVLSWVLGILSSILKSYSGLDKVFVSTLYTCAFFFAPLLVILIAYIVIFFSARKSMAIRRGNSFKKDLQIAYTVAFVIGVFVICWLPFFTLHLLLNFCGPCRSFVWNISVLMTVKLLHYVNSVCNPIIYCVRNKSFYRAFVRLLGHACFCKENNNSLQDDLDSTKMLNRVTVRHKERNGNHGETDRLTTTRVPARY